MLPVTITENASHQIKEMMKDEEENVRLRFGIKGGGCSGLSYSLGFEYDINPELDEVDELNEIPLVIFKQDIPILEGTTIDRKSTRLNSSHVAISYAVFCLKKKK